MSITRKTITVTAQQDDWIKARIAAGEFTNDSEYIRDLIRRDQASKADIETIRAARVKAEKSDQPQPVDGDPFKQKMITKETEKPETIWKRFGFMR